MKTQREQLLMLIVPAALVLMGYGWFFHSPQLREVRAKTAQIEKARTSAVSRGKLAEKQAELKTVKNSVTKLEQSLKEAEAQLAQGDMQLGSSLPISEASRKLTELMEAQKLRVTTAGLAVTNDAGHVLSPSLKTALERFKSKPHFKAPSLYRVQFNGEYTQVAKTLQLIAAEKLATPVQLQMAAAKPEVASRSWTLFVWL